MDLLQILATSQCAGFTQKTSDSHAFNMSGLSLDTYAGLPQQDRYCYPKDEKSYGAPNTQDYIGNLADPERPRCISKPAKRKGMQNFCEHIRKVHKRDNTSTYKGKQNEKNISHSKAI